MSQPSTSVGAFSNTPYGTLAAGSGTETTLLGFAGEYTDAESGLQYLRARSYDPAAGQCLTRDPMVDATGQPYAYADGDPIDNADPTGLITLDQIYLSNFTGLGMVRLAAPRMITGFTRHGLEQAIGREGAGVSPRAMLHTVKNATPSPQVGGTWKYVSDDATVVLNQRGQVVTTWPRGRQGMRNQP